MTEACSKLMEVLFNDGYNKIIIRAEVANIASNKVIEKCGFKFVKQELVAVPLKNKEVLCNCYEKTK